MRTLMLAVVFIVAGCVTGEKITNLRVGMSRTQVVETLGNPTGVQSSGEYEALRYPNQLMSGWSWDRADYYVVLRNGAVIEYGAGEVRQNDSNTLVLVPIVIAPR
jgi:hypothetical protein